MRVSCSVFLAGARCCLLVGDDKKRRRRSRSYKKVDIPSSSRTSGVPPLEESSVG